MISKKQMWYEIIFGSQSYQKVSGVKVISSKFSNFFSTVCGL